MRMRRSWWKAALLCVGLIVGGECVLEMMGLGRPILVTRHSPAKYELVPDQHIWRTWPLSESLIARAWTNRYGMRSGPVRATRPPHTLRVYLLGDSMTYGTTQVDQSEIFASLVEKKLPAVVHERVQVLDGAAGGWAPANELAYLREHGTLDANRVIVVLNDGDPTQAEAVDPYNEGIPSLSIHPVFGYQELWDRGLEPLIRRKLMRWHLMSPPSAPPGQAGDTVNENADVLGQNLKMLTEMQKFVEGSGGRMSIVFLPFVRKYYGPYTLGVVNESRDAVKQWAAERGVPFLNLTRELAPYGNSIRLRDHMHLNIEGNALVAKAIVSHWALLDSTPARIGLKAAKAAKRRGRS